MAVNGNIKVKEKSNQKGIVKFFKELKAEAKRITWPSKKDIKKASYCSCKFFFDFCSLCGFVGLWF